MLPWQKARLEVWQKACLEVSSNVIRCKPCGIQAARKHTNTETLLTKLKSLYQMQTLLLCIRLCGLTLKGSYSYHLHMQGSRLWLTQEQRIDPNMFLLQHTDSMQNMQDMACLTHAKSSTGCSLQCVAASSSLTSPPPTSRLTKVSIGRGGRCKG